MKKEYLIVDGYNIVNAWPELKELFNVSIEQARDKLIEIMAEFRAYKGVEVIIVFDGHLVKGNTGSSAFVKGVQVVYTKEQETADNYIESIIRDMSRRGTVRVATSDWTEQQVILALGGIRISASELYVAVKNAEGDIKKRFLNRGYERINIVGNNLSPDVADKLQKWRKSP